MNFLSVLYALLAKSGFAALGWQSAVMILISFVLMYLAIVKKFEPLLLLPIAFGIFLSNLPLAGTFSYFYEVEHWYQAGIIGVMYMGVKSSFFPCMMFLAVGAMTDFGPLIANPISLLLGAAAQLGIQSPLRLPLLYRTCRAPATVFGDFVTEKGRALGYTMAVIKKTNQGGTAYVCYRSQ